MLAIGAHLSGSVSCSTAPQRWHSFCAAPFGRGTFFAWDTCVRDHLLVHAVGRGPASQAAFDQHQESTGRVANPG